MDKPKRCPSRAKDITGERYGRLVALRRTDEFKNHGYVWECQCDCGRTCLVPISHLRHGGTKSCGCLADESRRGDITGEKRGHLTAIRPTERRESGATVWEWRCDCGATAYKAIYRVSTTASTMCPICSKALRREHAMLSQSRRDKQTGMMPGALEGLRGGKIFRNNTSGVRGVSWHAHRRKWVARVQIDKKTVTVGYYDTVDEAAEARQKAINQIYRTED